MNFIFAYKPSMDFIGNVFLLWIQNVWVLSQGTLLLYKRICEKIIDDIYYCWSEIQWIYQFVKSISYSNILNAYFAISMSLLGI